MRPFIFILAIVCVTSCGRDPQVIRVGQPADDALAALRARATDISKGVGIQVALPDRAHWFDLADGTCLQVVVSPGDNDAYRVTVLILGERGAGYGGKFNWMKQQHRRVDAVTLP